MHRIQRILILLVVFMVANAFTTPPNKKISKLGEYQGYNTSDYKGYSYQSQYVAMPDGVKLATDVFLPKKRQAEEKFPTIIYFVRYVRSIQLKKGWRFLGKPRLAHVPKKEIDFFTSKGYACVIVDLRGSGASFGFRKMEFSPEEVKDMGNLMDWIVEQPWSDKQLATTGVSYTGTTAELALSSKHPALKACIARCNIFDLYDDMNFPGGVRQAPFIKVWKKTTQALDFNDFSVFGGLAKMLVKGTNPVDADEDGKMLEEAVEQHKKNFDIFSGIFKVKSRDDIEPVTNLSTEKFSIHSRKDAITASKVPIYRISGWYDGANVHSAFKGYMSVPNTEKLLIGPWDHGPHENISPFTKSKKVKFSVYNEMLRFFDYHLKGIENGIEQDPPIHYYQMGKEKFVGVDEWPLQKASSHTYFINKDNTLAPKQQSAGSITYECDYTIGTTDRGRWNSLTGLYRGGPIGYGNRSDVNEKMLVFDAKVAEKNLEITGHPIVDLYVSADAKDTYLFVYLEDVAPNGKVTYITEGQLRALHRKEQSKDKAPYELCVPYHSYRKADTQPLVPNKVARYHFGLQPISYLLQEGHRLRVSVAVADIDHFDILEEKPSEIEVHFSEKYPSKVNIPVAE